MPERDDDAALMLRVRDGDREAFRRLVDRHQRAVINTIHRAIGDAWEAEDLAQRVFLQVFRAAHRYRPTAKFTTWMFTIVHNTIRNEYRRRQRHRAESLDALQDPSASGQPAREAADPKTPDPAATAANRELQERIEQAIAKLPEPQRMAVILCRFEGLSYEEIAEILKVSVSATKSLLHRARENLKEQLRGFY